MKGASFLQDKEIGNEIFLFRLYLLIKKAFETKTGTEDHWLKIIHKCQSYTNYN